MALQISSVQFSSVVQLHPALCNPTDYSSPGLPVYHQLPVFIQTYVHRVSDAIQLSHLLSSPSPAFNLSQHQGLSNELVLRIRWPKHWSFSITPSKEYSGLISFRIDWFDLLAVQGVSKVHKLLPFLKVLCEKAMTPHSSTLAWKIPWMEEPGRLQSMGSLRVGHD